MQQEITQLQQVSVKLTHIYKHSVWIFSCFRQRVYTFTREKLCAKQAEWPPYGPILAHMSFYHPGSLSGLKHMSLRCQHCCYNTVLMFHFHVFISATDLLLAWNPVCLGLVEGVIGKIQLHTGKWRTRNLWTDTFLPAFSVCVNWTCVTKSLSAYYVSYSPAKV